jgi:hypothetical protein
MKRITEIDDSIKAIQPKLDLGSRDWTKAEKEHIEKCYFEITKVSVGRGRTVDMGCDECVTSAVNIVKNYLALMERVEGVAPPQPKQEGGHDLTATAEEWKATVKSVNAFAKELNYTFSKESKTKEQKIQELEAFLFVDEEEESEEDLLGDEPQTKEELIKIIKAKTGEELSADDFSYEELFAIANSEEDGE